MNVLDFQKMKDEGRKISMVTCYDYSSARAVAESSVDCILVGDSVAMTRVAQMTIRATRAALPEYGASSSLRNSRNGTNGSHVADKFCAVEAMVNDCE